MTDTAPTPESAPTSTTPFSPEQLAVLTELIKGAVASAPSSEAAAPAPAPTPPPAPVLSPVESLLSRLRLQATPNAVDAVKGWLADHGVTLQ